jgi:hypothetical protein
MKRLTLSVILFLIPGLGLCQQAGVYRDSHGNTVGSWSDSGGQRTYRDSSGNTTGTSSRDNDRRDYRDRDGNYQGSSDRKERAR